MKDKSLNARLTSLSDKELRALVLSRLSGRELFPESNKIAKEILRKMKVAAKGL